MMERERAIGLMPAVPLKHGEPGGFESAALEPTEEEKIHMLERKLKELEEKLAEKGKEKPEEREEGKEEKEKGEEGTEGGEEKKPPEKPE
jgi:hypothetical protein